MSDIEWRQSPDSNWWYKGPDGSWHPSEVGPDRASAQAAASLNEATTAQRPSNWRPAASTLPKAPPLSADDLVASVSSPSTLATGAWLAIVAGVLAMVASFLPWEHLAALFVSVNRNGFQLGANQGFSVDGLIVLLLGMVTAIIGITKLTGMPAPTFLQRSSIVTGIALVVVAALEISPIDRQIHSVESVSSAASGSIGFGLWLAIISGVIAVLGGLVIRSNQA